VHLAHRQGIRPPVAPDASRQLPGGPKLAGIPCTWGRPRRSPANDAERHAARRESRAACVGVRASGRLTRRAAIGAAWQSPGVCVDDSASTWSARGASARRARSVTVSRRWRRVRSSAPGACGPGHVPLAEDLADGAGRTRSAFADPRPPWNSGLVMCPRPEARPAGGNGNERPRPGSWPTRVTKMPDGRVRA